MKRINLEPEYVVSKVLEQEGYDAPLELVKDWISGDAIPRQTSCRSSRLS